MPPTKKEQKKTFSRRWSFFFNFTLLKVFWSDRNSILLQDTFPYTISGTGNTWRQYRALFTSSLVRHAVITDSRNLERLIASRGMILVTSFVKTSQMIKRFNLDKNDTQIAFFYFKEERGAKLMCHYNYTQSLNWQICLTRSMFVEVNTSLKSKSLDEIRNSNNSAKAKYLEILKEVLNTSLSPNG